MNPARAPLALTSLVGLAAWCALLASGRFAEIGETLVALAVGFVVPLGIAATSDAPTRDGDVLPWMIAGGQALGLAAFVVPRGPLSGVLASGWLFASIAIAFTGLRRLARRGLGPVEELAIDAGHLYLPVGAVWLVASRSGAPLLGFHEPIVLYTADHFHFAGFAAPVVAGLTGREVGLRRAADDPSAVVASRALRVVASVAIAVVIVGVPLVAAGIVVSHSIELPAAVLLGSGMLALALLLVTKAIARLGGGARRSWTGALLGVAGASLVLSMSFALLFAATGSATRGAGTPLIAYATMARVHGIANAGGFASSALVAFVLSPPPRRCGPFGGSWPRLFANGFVGPDFFRRVGAIDSSRVVHGQIARLDDFAHAGFRPERAHPEVRAFYERTDEYELHVEPQWHAPFRLSGRAFAWFARRWLGQLELPVRPEGEEVVTTELFGVLDERDGRTDARGYVRSYGEGAARRANYVAVYSTHRAGDRALLSCAFPLPFGSLVAVLRFDDDAASPGGLVLSSHPRDGEGPSDEGMFLVTRLGPLRLSVDETILVRHDGEGLVATHATRVAGLACFTLRYRIHRRAGGEAA